MNKVLFTRSSLLIISILIAQSKIGLAIDGSRLAKNTSMHVHLTNLIVEAGRINLLSSAPGYGGAYTDYLKEKEIKGIEKKIADSTRPVSGKVISSVNNQPIEGVSVLVGDNKGGVGAITDKNGNFHIEIPEESKRIIFRAVGYKTQEIVLSASNTYNISMQYDTKGLDEVSVVAYGKQKLSTYTGSLGILKPESYEKVPRENVIESLQGNVAGVRVSKGNGQPGAPVSVQIRGKGSINSSSSPLYVIDGVPVDIYTGIDYSSYGGYTTSGLAGISPEDIESVTVLKDAAATSLYGSRAANGVVLITTKRGKAGKAKLHLSVQQGVNKVGIMKRGRPLNTKEMLELLKEGFINGGGSADQFPQLLNVSGVDSTQYTDWVDEMTRIGHFGKYYLSVSGGSDETQYFASGGYENSQGSLGKLDYKKGTARLSLNSQVLKRLAINADLSAYYQKTLNAGATFNYVASPLASIYKLQPWLKLFNDDGSYNLDDFSLQYNPLAVQEYTHLTGTATNVTGTVGAKLNLFEGMTFETKENMLITYGTTTFFSPDWFGWGRNDGGIGRYRSSIRKSWVTSNLLRYHHTFAGKHYLEAFLGYEAQSVRLENAYSGADHFIPNLEWMAAASNPTTATSSATENSVVGTFLNLQYNYDENYFFNASVRRDGSSRFGTKRRYGIFWSVGAGWNMKRTLLNDVSAIYALKLRSSYGVNGSQEIGNYDYAPRYGTGFDYDGAPGFVFEQFANPLLTWEQNAPFDIGIDFGLLGNRISGSLDYYVRKTSRLLLNRGLSATSGLTSFTDNYGSMRNSGVEISIVSENLVKPDGLSWTTSFNISTLKNKVLYMPNPTTSLGQIHETGSPYYTWYMPAYAGVDSETGVKLYYTDEDKTQTSENYNDAIRLKMGSAFPKFYGGLSNAFTYKNFKFSFLLYADWGRKIYSSHQVSLQSDGSKGFTRDRVLTRYYYDNRWQKPGDKTDAPKVVFNGPPSHNPSSRWLWDGSYIRLRDVSLSYTLPVKTVEAIGLQGVNIYIQGRDLAVWVPDEHVIYDPETGTSGFLDLKTPINKTIVLGVNIDF